MNQDADPAPAPDFVLGPAAEARSARMVRFSFGGLLVTQFLGALNDNILKYFVLFQLAYQGIWDGALGKGGLGLVSLLYSLPFILCSGLAGEICDKHSKRTVAVHMKTLEIPLVCLAGIGIYFREIGTTVFALFLMAAQSAFFGPAKYGMIPEIVPERRLPRANGSIGMTTNLAVILGMIGGGFTSKRFAEQPHLCFLILLVVAILGRISVLFVQKLEPKDPQLRYHANPFHAYGSSLRLMWSSRDICRAVFAWAFFYLVAIVAITAIPEMKESVTLDGQRIDDEQLSYLEAALAVAVGIGSLLVGWLSRGRIAKWPVLAGTLGMAAAFLTFFGLPHTFGAVMAVLCALGFWGGFYLIPLMTYMQVQAPDAARGQFLGTANFLSFVFMAVGSGVYAAMRQADLAWHHVLASCGVMLIGLATYVWTVNLEGRARGMAPAR